MAERRVGGRTSTRRLRDYEARRRELTDAFNLPDDTRTWVTVRLDDDPETEDRASLSGRAGQTSAKLDFPIPGYLKEALERFRKDHRADLEHQLKLDLATNLLAAMSGAPGPDED